MLCGSILSSFLSEREAAMSRLNLVLVSIGIVLLAIASTAHCACDITCVRIYALLDVTNAVGTGWKNSDGWLEEVHHPTDYGTSCHGDGARVRLVNTAANFQCNFQNVPADGLYSAVEVGQGGADTLDITPCESCQVDG